MTAYRPFRVAFVLGAVLAGQAQAAPPAKGSSAAATKAAPARQPKPTPARQEKEAPARPATPRDHKLQQGAQGSLCLDCHVDFEEQLKKASVHTPVRTRNCVGCHNPHASDHAKLLSADRNATCRTCHSVVPAGAVSTHKPVAEAKCTSCHEPHASAFKPNLVKATSDLCAGCHEKLAERAKIVKSPHRPVQESCLACHDAHASDQSPRLLKAAVPGLCVKCHKVDSAIFVKRHVNYPVAKARCTSCHDPHGSNNGSMLYDSVHPPVAKSMCGQCHEPPGSAAGFKPKLDGAALCVKCHSDRIQTMMNNPRVHRPVAEGSCTSCHAVHASPRSGLLKDGMVPVCGTCHEDTIRRQERSITKHQPIADGNCTACHEPHAAGAPLMFSKPTSVETCGTCHDWQKHSSHPLGDKVKDPRNKNLSLQCLSCHRAHGTEYKQMMPYATVTDLCTKCHVQFKR